MLWTKCPARIMDKTTEVLNHLDFAGVLKFTPPNKPTEARAAKKFLT
jgi:hypothetical protein